MDALAKKCYVLVCFQWKRGWLPQYISESMGYDCHSSWCTYVHQLIADTSVSSPQEDAFVQHQKTYKYYTIHNVKSSIPTRVHLILTEHSLMMVVRYARFDWTVMTSPMLVATYSLLQYCLLVNPYSLWCARPRTDTGMARSKLTGTCMGHKQDCLVT